ncbi:MAG: DUF3006 domain-containing protein [Candidatus Fermentibacteraceae bacterium]|nr:DUF3006 domain-containing protein [Candidatus Fermentibacteraceae bacterium]
MVRNRESSFNVDLDRIEEGIAVILAPGGFQWHLPESYLPAGVSEGMTMTVTLENNEQATSIRLERIRALRNNLENR